MDQRQTPLYTALVKHLHMNSISYHVPGHKSGRVFPKDARSVYENLLKIDVTELSGLDDLHDPEGPIMEAQQLTAGLYGVRNTFFLVNGSTVGNLSMILAACNAGDTVLVQRNSHKSIMNGIQLAGITPVFLTPEYDMEMKVVSGVSEETIRKAFNRYPNIKAIILTNPNYYGMSSNLSAIVKLAHKNGTSVLVDEAHGAHFIHEGFPTSAIDYGADIVVHSAHKTLPAMTMGSYLHFNSDLVDIKKLKLYLQMLQSSSPSYPIMASLDIARSYLASFDKQDIDRIREQVTAFKKELNQIKGIRVVESSNPLLSQDLLKVTIQSNCSWSGYELQKIFEQKGIFTELADPYNVLFVLPLTTKLESEDTIARIKEALQNKVEEQLTINNTYLYFEPFTELAIGYEEQNKYRQIKIPIDKACGYISAEMVTPYPPGIPLLMVGEEISKEHIGLLLKYKNSGARFQGSVAIKEDSLIVFDKK
ncbi:aminotransferase class I/II-fold pyridoxal phosphate-dependent enzyme [Bacillus luteolus]|uniref:Aminotransferase class I/II-fold pyridoxal phosphate-dependent enzyme n=1 Tax=Litchfieldia luteola TaxID=682179 RepID=A0ABR9QDS0_9BACI|nr:aminotransferase class I/II-fold pyridoxal phosphate-dependent enzyme [Cytobacillus luteolus]MBE4906642.1 aminotransferase class I/II-fold pyridoxal phosphate-dependent enzyme [Cytobacillus luteolus]MBP1944441.1 lysine decarboxylase [Cytobacillus luteolus]